MILVISILGTNQRTFAILTLTIVLFFFSPYMDSFSDSGTLTLLPVLVSIMGFTVSFHDVP